MFHVKYDTKPQFMGASGPELQRQPKKASESVTALLSEFQRLPGRKIIHLRSRKSKRLFIDLQINEDGTFGPNAVQVSMFKRKLVTALETGGDLITFQYPPESQDVLIFGTALAGRGWWHENAWIAERYHEYDFPESITTTAGMRVVYASLRDEELRDHSVWWGCLSEQEAGLAITVFPDQREAYLFAINAKKVLPVEVILPIEVKRGKLRFWAGEHVVYDYEVTPQAV